MSRTAEVSSSPCSDDPRTTNAKARKTWRAMVIHFILFLSLCSDWWYLVLSYTLELWMKTNEYVGCWMLVDKWWNYYLNLYSLIIKTQLTWTDSIFFLNLFLLLGHLRTPPDTSIEKFKSFPGGVGANKQSINQWTKRKRQIEIGRYALQRFYKMWKYDVVALMSRSRIWGKNGERKKTIINV